MLNTNADCLQLALRNLHENAVQHTREGRVAWTARGNALAIEDEGPGFPPTNSIKSEGASSGADLRSPVGSGLALRSSSSGLRRSGRNSLYRTGRVAAAPDRS